jgi:hypothetical protein
MSDRARGTASSRVESSPVSNLSRRGRNADIRRLAAEVSLVETPGAELTLSIVLIG